jgi:hypothetical protein
LSHFQRMPFTCSKIDLKMLFEIYLKTKIWKLFSRLVGPRPTKCPVGQFSPIPARACPHVPAVHGPGVCNASPPVRLPIHARVAWLCCTGSHGWWPAGRSEPQHRDRNASRFAPNHALTSVLTVDKYHFLTINIAWKRTKQ